MHLSTVVVTQPGTSSSAVAKRPRDALCLSVVSFNSTKRLLLLVTWATDLSLCAIKCSSAVFGVMLRLLVINISSSSPVINELRRLLPAVSQLATVWQHRVHNT